MKRCTYCGKEYPDDMAVCAVDQNLLEFSVAALSVPSPESESMHSDRPSMKYFIVPVILWGYIFSVALAKGFWGVVFGRLAESFHWSWSQALGFLVVLNLLVGSIGIPQVLAFVGALRRREMMTVSQHVGSSLCISAASLCFAAVIFCIAYMIRLPSQ